MTFHEIQYWISQNVLTNSCELKFSVGISQNYFNIISAEYAKKKLFSPLFKDGKSISEIWRQCHTEENYRASVETFVYDNVTLSRNGKHFMTTLLYTV